MTFPVIDYLLSERNNPHSRVRANGVRWWGYPSRNAPIRAIGVHTTENSPGEGVALNVAAWQAATAPAPSSYHVIVDTRDIVRTVDDSHTAFHIAGFNSPSLGLSFATRAALWGTNSTRDRAMLDRGAQQAARWAVRHSIPLRWLTKAEAERGGRGFVRHSTMDPTRRSDPGGRFPAAEFFSLVAAHMEDDMTPDDLYRSIVPGTDESFALHQRHTLIHLRWLRTSGVPAVLEAVGQAVKAAEAAASGDVKTAHVAVVDAQAIAERVRRELADALAD